MIGFIFKGVIRDKGKSLFPLLVVSSGVMLTVFLYCWIRGAKNEFIESSARYNTGHLKIMTRAYANESDLIPNDLAYMGVSSLLQELKNDYPEILWVPRILFSGLLDIPDEKGETKAQGPIAGIAVDLISKNSPEHSIMNFKKGLIDGEIPDNEGEILVSSELSKSLSLKPGDRTTIISSTITGGLAVADFKVSGIIRFGITSLDKGTVIADIRDIQKLLDMEDSAGEVIGLFKDFVYREKYARKIASDFNKKFENLNSEDSDFLPVMLTLEEQGGLGELLAMFTTFSSAIIAVFVAVMSIILWNAGLMSSLRRYGEIGVRLAMGEGKWHIYLSLITESLIIGIIGSAVGITAGLAISYYLQVNGINIESFMKQSTLMFGNVMRAEVTPVSFVIGFIPGLFATFLGTAIAGTAVFRRKTSTLMKEFEA